MTRFSLFFALLGRFDCNEGNAFQVFGVGAQFRLTFKGGRLNCSYYETAVAQDPLFLPHFTVPLKIILYSMWCECERGGPSSEIKPHPSCSSLQRPRMHAWESLVLPGFAVCVLGVTPPVCPIVTFKGFF